MSRPKNTVTITRANRQGSMYDLWFDTIEGRVRIRRSSATILKAVKHFRDCPLKDNNQDIEEQILGGKA